MYAVESYFLRKTVYYDKLESKDKNRHTMSSDHIRMRGIPTPCIKYKAKHEQIGVMGMCEKRLKVNHISLT